jgi:hypothetical protein
LVVPPLPLLFFPFSFLYQLSRPCFYMFHLLTLLQVFQGCSASSSERRDLQGGMLRNAHRETTYPSL